MRTIVFQLITFICLVVSWGVVPQFAHGSNKVSNEVILFSLLNDSRYKESWNIESHLSDMLHTHLSEKKSNFTFVLQSYHQLNGFKPEEQDLKKLDLLIDFANQKKASYVITGVIKKFTVEVSEVDSPNLGKWNIYSGECLIHMWITDVGKNRLYFKSIQTSHSDHQVGIPLEDSFDTSRSKKKKIRSKDIMARLATYSIDSEMIKKSVMGHAVTKAKNQMGDFFIKKYPDQKIVSEGSVLDIDENFLYINLGSANGVVEGQNFFVKSKSKESIIKSKIVIEKVLAAKFSRAKAVTKKNMKIIKIGDTIFR